MDVALGADPPALAVIDRAHRLLGLVDGIERRIDGREIARPDQPLAVLEALGDDAPVARLLRQAREIAGDAGAGLLGGAGGFEEGLLAVGRLAGHDRETGQHRAARLQEVPVEVADQRVAAPARPDLGEGQRRKHPHRHIAGAAVAAAVGVVEHQPRRRHGECAAGRGALGMDRIAGRPAPRRTAESAVMRARHIGRGELGGERQERIGLQAARVGAGRSERAFERAAERGERRLGCRSGQARQTGGDEHPVVAAGEGRAAGMHRAPAGMAEQTFPSTSHRRLDAARAGTRLGPRRERRAEAWACPVNELQRAALGRGVGQGSRERPQSLLVDPRERRQFDHETAARRIDVELAALVPGAPGQQFVQRRQHLGRGPGAQRLRPLEQIQQARDHWNLQPAGSITTRTQPAS